MGERINPTNLSDGVFKSGELRPGKNDSVTYYTRSLKPGERFNHANELPAIIQDNVEYRVMNPVLSKLAASICSGLIDNIFVRSGSNVLFLAGLDASSVFTISYLSDIVGKDGMVFVAGKSEVVKGDNRLREFDIRSNVQFIAVDDTIYQASAVACKSFIDNLGKTVDVLFCDVGHHDQLDCLLTNASMIMKNGSNFVAFLKAHQNVHVNYAENLAKVPNISIFLEFRQRLEGCGLFQHLKGTTLQFYTEWCCVLGTIIR